MVDIRGRANRPRRRTGHIPDEVFDEIARDLVAAPGKGAASRQSQRLPSIPGLGLARGKRGLSFTTAALLSVMLKFHIEYPTISDYALYRLAAAIHVRAVGAERARLSIIRNLKRYWPRCKAAHHRDAAIARQRHAEEAQRRQLAAAGGLLSIELPLPEASADEEKSASVTQ